MQTLVLAVVHIIVSLFFSTIAFGFILLFLDKPLGLNLNDTKLILGILLLSLSILSFQLTKNIAINSDNTFEVLKQIIEELTTALVIGAMFLGTFLLITVKVFDADFLGLQDSSLYITIVSIAIIYISFRRVEKEKFL